MVEKLKALNDLFEAITIINSEISALDESFKHVQLSSSIIGDELENNLKSIEIIFKKNIDSRKEKKKEIEDSFRKLMFDIFGIKIKLKGNSLVLESEKIDDPYLEEYKKALSCYIELFNSTGIFDDELCDKLNQSIHEMLDIALQSSQLLKLVRESQISYLEETNLFSMMSIHIDEYKDIIMRYRELLKYIILNDKSPFSESSIQYIVNNTSLLPLVFANNNHSLIKKPTTLKPLFSCQFHVDQKPSMRVRLDTNYFVCYGCGKTGNQIEYLSQFHNISYTDAIYLLAEIFLIDLPDNPFKEGEKANLVSSYREVLISDEYRAFLVDSMSRTCENDPENKSIYLNLFSQIERVKSGTWDLSFQFEPNSKRFMNLNSNKDAVRSLLPEGDFCGFLPF